MCIYKHLPSKNIYLSKFGKVALCRTLGRGSVATHNQNHFHRGPRMLHRHSHTIAMMNRDRVTRYLLCDYFQLRRGATLMSSLCDQGLGQADLVLALLRLRDQCRTPYARIYGCYITLLVGHPITVGPACLLQYRVNGHPTAIRSTDDRRLTFVLPDNPRQPRTEAHLRWCQFQVGRTVAQLRVRGVTKRDIRRAVRRGWIKLEELTS